MMPFMPRVNGEKRKKIKFDNFEKCMMVYTLSLTRCKKYAIAPVSACPHAWFTVIIALHGSTSGFLAVQNTCAKVSF